MDTGRGDNCLNAVINHETWIFIKELPAVLKAKELTVAIVKDSARVMVLHPWGKKETSKVFKERNTTTRLTI